MSRGRCYVRYFNLYREIHTRSYKLYSRRNFCREFGLMVPVIVRTTGLMTGSDIGDKGLGRDNAHTSPMRERLIGYSLCAAWYEN